MTSSTIQTQSAQTIHHTPVRTESSPTRPQIVRVVVWLVSALAVVLIVSYFVASAYLADQATRATRHLPQGTPADQGLQYEAVTFESAEDHIPLRGWYIQSRAERAIVMVHGIDSQRWDETPNNPDKTRLLVNDGFDVFLFDLRAHGESDGEHLGLGWLERRDVRAAVDVVEQHGIPAGRIGLLGHSFGGGIALLSAAVIPDVAAVMTDSAFADQRLLLDREINMRTGAPPIFTPGIGLFVSQWYDLDLSAIAPDQALARIAPRPILFIHGGADTRIPVSHAYRLMAASHNPADELWIVPGAEHVASFAVQPETYTAKMLAFFEHYLQ